MIAVFVLMLQLTAVGLATGAQAASQHPGAFDVICASAPADAPSQDGDTSHGAGLNCCVMGCAMFGPALAPPPAAEVFVAPDLRASIALALPRAPDRVRPWRHSSSHARAPPSAA